jgi:hypothetical protein
VAPVLVTKSRNRLWSCCSRTWGSSNSTTRPWLWVRGGACGQHGVGGRGLRRDDAGGYVQSAHAATPTPPQAGRHSSYLVHHQHSVVFNDCG